VLYNITPPPRFTNHRSILFNDRINTGRKWDENGFKLATRQACNRDTVFNASWIGLQILPCETLLPVFCARHMIADFYGYYAVLDAGES